MKKERQAYKGRQTVKKQTERKKERNSYFFHTWYWTIRILY